MTRSPPPARRSRPSAQPTGRSWDAGSIRVLFDLGADQEALFASGPADYAGHGPFDFADPDTLVANGATPDYFRPESRAWIRVSTDGGDSWLPPILADPVLPSAPAVPQAPVRSSTAGRFITPFEVEVPSFVYRPPEAETEAAGDETSVTVD